MALLPTIHEPDDAVLLADRAGNAVQRALGRFDGCAHLLRCFQGGLGCTVLGGRIQQVRPVHQRVVQQVVVQRLLAALEVLERLLAHHAALDVHAAHATRLLVGHAVERHVELALPSGARFRVNQARLLGHIQHVLVESVERGQRILVSLGPVARGLALARAMLQREVKRQLAVGQRLQCGNILWRE